MWRRIMTLRWREFWRGRGVRMSIMMLWVVRRMEAIRIRVWICIRLYCEFWFLFVFISVLTSM